MVMTLYKIVSLDYNCETFIFGEDCIVGTGYPLGLSLIIIQRNGRSSSFILAIIPGSVNHLTSF